jgi:hypothetical protein
MFSPKLVKNFLTQEECDYLVNLVKGIEPWETGGSDFWNNRSLNGITLYNDIDKVAGTLIYNIRNKIKETIKQEYSLANEVYPDLCQIVRWFPGQEQHPHADDMKNTEGNDWFHHRDYGAIIYLNDDYDGGHTYYPNYNFDIKPETGALAIHPGDSDHLHGVTKIEKSTRYTIASFWTLDKEYHDGWTIP